MNVHRGCDFHAMTSRSAILRDRVGAQRRINRDGENSATWQHSRRGRFAATVFLLSDPSPLRWYTKVSISKVE